ncbi:hypothetical protein AB0A05_07395 [Streptomyces sp. NPDC046374]|uniref:hypothetical protein n=1 Tax=Streptomyces sp. NPDC046374 TaxID=3154917 RepID=UPI0033D41403
MTNLRTLIAGSTVQLLAFGTSQEARVAKVGRTLIHVYRNAEYPEWGTDAYRKGDGRSNDILNPCRIKAA